MGINVMEKASWFKLAWKSIALAASTGAALVTVFSALYTYGLIGKAEAHNSIGNIGAAWVGVRPAVDTASAIGDTVHYAATIADKNGSILVGARPTWTTGDSAIAVAHSDGSVVGRHPGITTVSVVVGNLVAHSRIVVRQKVATVDLPGMNAESLVVAEGQDLPLKARALDSRGHAILSARADWQVEDTSVAAIDTNGVVTGHNPGRTAMSARIDGVTKHIPLYVVTTASNIALVAGSSQHALAGSTLPQAIVVRATNRRGAPSAAQAVRFKLAAGQGSVAPATMLTDADGRARATWTLGDYPGRQTLFASVDRVDSALAIVAEAEPVASNTRVTAVVDTYVGQAGEPLADSVAVRVTDSTGRVLPDVPVRWTALDGAVESGAGRTDSLGVARARWTLAKRTGTQRLRAQVGGGTAGRAVPPTTIVARAMAGAAVGLVVVSGDGQRGSAGATLDKAVVLRVVDTNGSGVADAVISLSPSGGSVPDSSVRTDSTGVARMQWKLGHSAGDYSLSVKVDGVKKLLKVAARAMPAAPANLSFDDAPPSIDKHSHGKGKRLYALVTDVYGNPVSDVAVSFSTKSGTVTPARAVTDTQGRAAVSWTPSTKGGDQALVGAVRSTDVRGEYRMSVAASHEPTVHMAGEPKTTASKKSKRSR